MVFLACETYKGTKKKWYLLCIYILNSDPPSDDPTIQQTPNRPIINREKVVLTCSVSGGFPLPILSWNCSGNSTNNTSGNTAFYTVIFMAFKQDNGKTCTCSAAHPVQEYRPQMHVTLNVYCKSLSHKINKVQSKKKRVRVAILNCYFCLILSNL